MNAKERYELWNEKVSDSKLKEELTLMASDEKKINDSFFKELEFGTGGMRGEIGVGVNCLNIYTIRKATQGLANYLVENGKKSVAISRDSRINSELFSTVAAEVLAERGLIVYVTKDIMPTPFLSFMVRNLKTDLGIMITASHNPKEYNGYKVYGDDGCQITDDLANILTNYIKEVDAFAVTTKDFSEYKNIKVVDDSVVLEYLSNVEKQSICQAEDLKVVYSALNGTGYKLVPKMLLKVGVKDLTLVKEQCEKDCNFTTCPYPNPEKPMALFLGVETAKKVKADILLATDPDCDRVGVAVLSNGEYTLMTGNEMGVLLVDFILSEKKNLPKNPIIVKTIVTTDLADRIANDYGAEVRNVLTGFKYIGSEIAKLEKNAEENRYVFGLEESYGYLAGSYVRDKDAVVASMLIAEMASFYKKKGKTLCDRMNEIYLKYGLYEHKLLSYKFTGADGFTKMQNILKSLREKPITNIAKLNVDTTTDYLTQTETDLPKANVLKYVFNEGCSVIIRPSGTEPYIKVYVMVNKTKEENEKLLGLITAFMNEKLS